jgi:hypothetical protein
MERDDKRVGRSKTTKELVYYLPLATGRITCEVAQCHRLRLPLCVAINFLRNYEDVMEERNVYVV